MELTLDQALQQGVAAHKEGKLQDAERLYRAILQAQPKHPDANHNLGVLAVEVGKPLEAIPLFKLALETNPQMEQFWLSYIDALIKLGRLEEAKRVLVEGERSGVSSDKLDGLKRRLTATVSNDTTGTAKGQTLSEKRKNLAERKKSKKRKAQSSTPIAEPSRDQLHHLLEHYKAGRLEEAEALAASLTQQFPKHQFAWTVLGGLLMQMGRPEEALLPMQKSAELLPQNPATLSNLGGTLQALGRLDEAEANLRRAIALKPDYAEAHYNLGLTHHKLGRASDAEASYREALALKTDYVDAHHNLGNMLRESGRLDEAEETYIQAISLRPDYAEAHHNLGSLLQELGRLDEAEASFRRATAHKPNYPSAFLNLGITLQHLGKLDEAESNYRQAITLEPDFANAHLNLGNTLRHLGKLRESEASYRRAISLKPDFAEAHSNLGIILRDLGKLDESEASLKKAIASNPNFAAAHNNLGVTFKEQGRLDAAISSYLRAINLEADSYHAYDNLGLALRGATFTEENPSLYPVLINLLTTGNFVRPSSVASSILSLLKQANLLEDLLLNIATLKKVEEIERAIKVLAQFPLLQQLMRICPLPELRFEAALVSLRRALLMSLEKIEISPELLYFLSTLSLHCYTNEYVYFETAEETTVIRALEESIAEIIARPSQPNIAETLCLATYRPLHQYDWSDRLQVLDELPDLQKRLIQDPRTEEMLARDMPVLAEVEDSVSRMVRQQYEESPYPRWVKLRFPPNANSVAKVVNEANLQLHSEKIKSVSSPSILIAGCGTGQHALETGLRFANCQVIAVDLSRKSLAYAQRASSELGITNIRYLQADILNLGVLGKEFDIVESAGVLHHMDNPMAGWSVLVGLLKTGGLMKIGLYSELARRHIAMTREEISLQEVGTSEADIRQFRQSLIESHHEHHKSVTISLDFFSLSTFRDLVFHVQEHRFTIPQIQDCLDQLGLKFCGFESQSIVNKFKRSFGEESDTCDLSLWHQYEESQQSTFAGMYQFWCQKL